MAFSGGKDSLICLDLCRDYRSQFDLCWVNTGAMFPHMEAFVRKAAEGYNFVELKSDVGAWREKYGEPADVVPVFNSFAGIGLEPTRSRPALQPWTVCCFVNRMKPLYDYTPAPPRPNRL